TPLRLAQWMKLKGSDSAQLDHTSTSKSDVQTDNQKENSKFGTVGAVALDLQGNLAAATSTGGMTNKRFGRIGDSPIIGAGTYANNQTCAVSCTGHGEYFIRSVAAYDVSALMSYKNLSISEACMEVINNISNLNGKGGLIAVDKNGNVAMHFNCGGMFRGMKDSDGKSEVFIF
ncbi:MAG: isoaspartyl peptidase/L-asparaginase, partial [Chitinophagales bacterium]|nr:isoaspartyl peptidase/L-asparaginase [Chitinophagales bacterium]